MSRNVARRLDFIPPAELIWKFLIGLKGPSKKMSGSIPDSAIYLTDRPEDIKRKIKSAYSGGSPLASMQKERGAIVEIDPIFSLLSFNFLNDSEWEKIHESYSKGELMTGELKKLATEYVLEFVSDHQQKRIQAKKNINEFMLTTPLKSVLELDSLPGISS
jgi:tryptophanyl-tRNA synthetase